MNKLLLVIDMQNDFISGSLGTKEACDIVPNVVKKIDSYQKNNLPVYFTLDNHDCNYLETLEGQNLPIIHCVYGTEGYQLCDEIAKIITSFDTSKVYNKHTFGSVTLSRMLEEYAQTLSEIEIVGVATNICVISNALLLAAHLPKTQITIDASCCAGTTPEMHLMALNVMKSCQMAVIGEASE